MRACLCSRPGRGCHRCRHEQRARQHHTRYSHVPESRTYVYASAQGDSAVAAAAGDIQEQRSSRPTSGDELVTVDEVRALLRLRCASDKVPMQRMRIHMFRVVPRLSSWSFTGESPSKSVTSARCTASPAEMVRCQSLTTRQSLTVLPVLSLVPVALHRSFLAHRGGPSCCLAESVTLQMSRTRC